MRIAGKLSRREQTALIFCLAFLAATILLSLADRNSLLHRLRGTVDSQHTRYTGTIVTPDEVDGRCRFTLYDNRTSEFLNREVANCSARPGMNAPNERINALRDAFKR
jgi:hypothetical protein